MSVIIVAERGLKDICKIRSNSRWWASVILSEPIYAYIIHVTIIESWKRRIFLIILLATKEKDSGKSSNLSVCVCMCVYIYVYVHLCISMNVSIYVCTYVYICGCTCEFVHVVLLSNAYLADHLQ
mgnify:CR=1 FL=1